ncbi:MAG: preprotein translocase subunit Sec61beta [Archaeoglobi archaeon]|jgi:preprotein translocase subunit Sec61beta|nr:preprotein translocase subunit Sec61beta [Archaeoglobus sp.]NHW89091.1 preprotein translocase subunit Sec61beta [Archaeoglobales archaeon]TDA25858.1 MAG: preprotein translocase subunit Sec61beta [Archaeoglobi archaeon]TDA26254.1 MAG: preprotein translocase subunit Sec61beta [Archaeoglobi archaeon]
MAKVSKVRTRNPPLMSSAGIMRYFEEEKTRIKINPKTVLITGILTGFIVIFLNAFYGLWP